VSPHGFEPKLFSEFNIYEDRQIFVPTTGDFYFYRQLVKIEILHVRRDFVLSFEIDKDFVIDTSMSSTYSLILILCLEGS